MKIDEAIEVLELHNQWRKGAEIQIETPARIGIAMDLVICELKDLRRVNIISFAGKKSGDKCTTCTCNERIESLQAIKDLIVNTPNDQELGKMLRGLLRTNKQYKNK